MIAVMVSKEQVFVVKEIALMLLVFGAVAALACWFGERGEIKRGKPEYAERMNVRIQNCLIDYVARIPSELLPSPGRLRGYCTKFVTERKSMILTHRDAPFPSPPDSTGQGGRADDLRRAPHDLLRGSD